MRAVHPLRGDRTAPYMIGRDAEDIDAAFAHAGMPCRSVLTRRFDISRMVEPAGIAFARFTPDLVKDVAAI